VRPTLLMCYPHWQQVPLDLQRAVWRTYRRGQYDDQRPSSAWLEAAGAAVAYVALFEGRKVSVNEARSLVRAGYERFVITQMVRSLGEGLRATIEAKVQSFLT